MIQLFFKQHCYMTQLKILTQGTINILRKHAFGLFGPPCPLKHVFKKVFDIC